MSAETIRVITFVLPPVLGAVIGYVTNAIAIRMLFRPLTEKRVFGLRVPFTPGIIPRQRGQLAESIGRMVSQKLLTEETLRRHLTSEGFRGGLRQRISVWTESIVVPDDVAYGNRVSESPPPADKRASRESEFDLLSDAAYEFAGTLIEQFLRSHRLDLIVRSATSQVLSGLGSVRLEEVLSDPEAAAELLSDLLTDMFEGPVTTSVGEFADSWIVEQIDSNVPMDRYLTDAFIEVVESAVQSGYEPIFAHAMEWLRRPDVKSELSHRGRIILRDVLDRLNVFQRFFVSAAQYERNLNERMPEIVNDMLGTIENAGRLPANRDRVVRAVGDALRKVQQLGIADATELLDFDLRAFVSRTVPEAFRLMQSREVHAGIVSGVTSIYNTHRSRTLGEVLRDVSGMEEQRMTEHALQLIREWLNKPGASESLSRHLVGLIRSFVEDARVRHRGPIASVPRAQKESFDAFLSERVVMLVASKTSDLVEAVDIHSMVVDKINELDIENVESLLLMVIARHLKWINLFGGILGSLIGTIQVVVNLLL